MTTERPLSNTRPPRGRRLGRRVARTVLAVAAGLLLGLGIDVLRSGGLDSWLASRAPNIPILSSPYDARGRTVEVDGRDVYLDCRGAGSPTVILEAGFGSGAGSWGDVLEGVSAFTRVCAWDRPGLGRSTSRGLHTGTQTAADLRAALDGAGETGPFVVVAHSLGGVYARLFAATPGPAGGTDGTDAVLGFVMIDTYEPDLGMDVDPALPADLRALVRSSIDDTGAMIQNGEALDWAATMAELAELGPVQVPATTLWVDQRARYQDPDPARSAALIDAWNRAVAARYPIGLIEIVPGAGHLIHLERPALVIDRIREMVLRQRSP